MTALEHAPVQSDVEILTQLILRERQGRDRGWWHQMGAAFHEDATVRLSWFNGSAADFTAKSEIMYNNGNRAIHRLSPATVHVYGDRAVIEMPSGIEFRALVESEEADIISYARLLYRAERRAGVWKLYRMDAIYERDTITPAIPGRTINIAPAALAGARPSYRMIAYHLARLGYGIPDDLYGDDQPEPVAQLYREAFAWAGGVAPGR